MFDCAAIKLKSEQHTNTNLNILMQLISARNHLMCCEEIIVSLGSLKMVSRDTKLCRKKTNICVCIHSVVHESWSINGDILT